MNIDGSGAITEAIVDVDGFIGLGEKLVVRSLSNLDILHEYAGDKLRVYIAITKEQMEALPTLKNKAAQT